VVEEKPPEKKPNGIWHQECEQTAKAFWMLTGDGLPAETLRNTKSVIQPCTWENHQTFKNTSVFDKDNESVVLSDQNNAFVFLFIS
jgi:hypothetical protein